MNKKYRFKAILCLALVFSLALNPVGLYRGETAHCLAPQSQTREITRKMDAGQTAQPPSKIIGFLTRPENWQNFFFLSVIGTALFWNETFLEYKWLLVGSFAVYELIFFFQDKYKKRKFVLTNANQEEPQSKLKKYLIKSFSFTSYWLIAAVLAPFLADQISVEFFAAYPKWGCALILSGLVLRRLMTVFTIIFNTVGYFLGYFIYLYSGNEMLRPVFKNKERRKIASMVSHFLFIFLFVHSIFLSVLKLQNPPPPNYPIFYQYAAVHQERYWLYLGYVKQPTGQMVFHLKNLGAHPDSLWSKMRIPGMIDLLNETVDSHNPLTSRRWNQINFQVASILARNQITEAIPVAGRLIHSDIRGHQALGIHMLRNIHSPDTAEILINLINEESLSASADKPIPRIMDQSLNALSINYANGNEETRRRIDSFFEEKLNSSFNLDHIMASKLVFNAARARHVDRIIEILRMPREPAPTTGRQPETDFLTPMLNSLYRVYNDLDEPGKQRVLNFMRDVYRGELPHLNGFPIQMSAISIPEELWTSPNNEGADLFVTIMENYSQNGRPFLPMYNVYDAWRAGSTRRFQSIKPALNRLEIYIRFLEQRGLKAEGCIEGLLIRLGYHEEIAFLNRLANDPTISQQTRDYIKRRMTAPDTIRKITRIPRKRPPLPVAAGAGKKSHPSMLNALTSIFSSFMVFFTLLLAFRNRNKNQETVQEQETSLELSPSRLTEISI